MWKHAMNFAVRLLDTTTYTDVTYMWARPCPEFPLIWLKWSHAALAKIDWGGLSSSAVSQEEEDYSTKDYQSRVVWLHKPKL